MSDIIIVNGLPRSTKALRAYSDHEPEHGRYTTYNNYGCRCPECTADNTRYIADYRRRNPGYTRPKRKRKVTT